TDGVQALVEGLTLPSLTSLDIAAGSLRDEGARAVAACPALGGLRKLRLSGGSAFKLPGVRAVASSPVLARLEHLDLSSNSSAIRVLVRSPHLTGLKALSLSGVQLGLDGVRVLADSPNWARLETLDLSSTGLDSPSVRALVKSPHLKNLAALDLRQTSWGQ